MKCLCSVIEEYDTSAWKSLIETCILCGAVTALSTILSSSLVLVKLSLTNTFLIKYNCLLYSDKHLQFIRTVAFCYKSIQWKTVIVCDNCADLNWITIRLNLSWGEVLLKIFTVHASEKGSTTWGSISDLEKWTKGLPSSDGKRAMAPRDNLSLSVSPPKHFGHRH